MTELELAVRARRVREAVRRARLGRDRGAGRAWPDALVAATAELR